MRFCGRIEVRSGEFWFATVTIDPILSGDEAFAFGCLFDLGYDGVFALVAPIRGIPLNASEEIKTVVFGDSEWRIAADLKVQERSYIGGSVVGSLGRVAVRRLGA